jgi:hypothetical protein
MTHFPDQSSPRHRRDYFATAVEAVPPLLQALAAIAASVAFAFANHRFVALWSVIIVAALSVLVLVISGIWSWRARRLLVDREAKVPSERGRGLSVNAPTWSWGAVIAGAILISGSIFILVRGLMPSPNYSSPYDGLNPQQSPCLDSAKKVPGGNTTLFDDSGRSVGVVTLMQSVNCSAVWGRVILTQQAAVRLKDYTIKIIIERPGDSVEIPYAIALNGATVAYGSMLSDSQACVRAEVTLRPNNSSSYGKYSVTPCIAQT